METLHNIILVKDNIVLGSVYNTDLGILKVYLFLFIAQDLDDHSTRDTFLDYIAPRKTSSISIDEIFIYLYKNGYNCFYQKFDIEVDICGDGLETKQGYTLVKE